MKKLILALLSIIALSACTANWEYKIVTIGGKSISEFESNFFPVSSEDLNLFGKDGWELVDVYTIVETVHPNFGNSEYVSGLRDNSRTSSVNYVFKRRK